MSGAGEVAYSFGPSHNITLRNLRDCPPERAMQCTLWPFRRPLTQRVWFWFDEVAARLVGHQETAKIIHETRTLWRRHPWMRTGEVWWRPYWGDTWPDAVGTIETIDVVGRDSGLHQWNVTPNIANYYAFDVEAYYCAVLRRNLL